MKPQKGLDEDAPSVERTVTDTKKVAAVADGAVSQVICGGTMAWPQGMTSTHAKVRPGVVSRSDTSRPMPLYGPTLTTVSVVRWLMTLQAEPPTST